jgi:3-oxoacyl-(acyl-carrier-protein) synthase
MALFAQYAMVAAQEALDDAEWNATTEDDLEATVSAGLPSVARLMANI